MARLTVVSQPSLFTSLLTMTLRVLRQCLVLCSVSAKCYVMSIRLSQITNRLLSFCWHCVFHGKLEMEIISREWIPRYTISSTDRCLFQNGIPESSLQALNLLECFLPTAVTRIVSVLLEKFPNFRNCGGGLHPTSPYTCGRS